MSEPGRISNTAAPATLRVGSGGKSMNDIESQRKRIEDTFRDAYFNAERIDSNSARARELNRLNARLGRMHSTADRYVDNIMNQPENLAGYAEAGNLLRNARTQTELLATRPKRLAIYNTIENRRYPRSIYARNNRR